MGSKARLPILIALLIGSLAPAISDPAPAEARMRVLAAGRTTRSVVGSPRARRSKSLPSGRSRRRDTRASHRSGRHKQRARAPKVRYAYPINFFLWHAPEFDRTPFAPETRDRVRQAFLNGVAEEFSPRALVRAGVVQYHPLRGGIFWRREPVKYIIVHSTETGIPLSATRVIDAWSSGGRRHAGAQYVVDRDGTVWQAVDPDLATVHVNIFKTLPGINNDNSIGIEMCHAGKQTYPPEQRAAVLRLVSYLQDRYKVSDVNVITHRYAQQGDHTDPVAFHWEGFLTEKALFRRPIIAARMRGLASEAPKWWLQESPTASTILQLHDKLPVNEAASRAQANVAIDSTLAPDCVTPQEADITVSPQTVPRSKPSAATLPPESRESPPATILLPLRGPIEIAPASARDLNATPSDSPRESQPNAAGESETGEWDEFLRQAPAR